ncbi:MAG TPA: DUF4214 domain-containing protein [Pyrinomonadaceae bacterium]|nr:DUF4214 domain-containing protein [Pyrinomonadaceae bacterium]
MTNAERVSSAINTGNLVWNGPQAKADSSILALGRDTQGRPQMYAPNPREAGSSVSHWSNVASPNQLMEPNNSFNLGHNVTLPQDLTFSLLRDLGWCAGCPQPPPPPPPPPAPANNNFANAQTISGCSGSVSGTTVSATKETGEPSHSDDGNSGGASIWYKWQAPSSGSVTMTTAGSMPDTLLGVWTGSSVSSLTLIKRNDDVQLGVITTSTVTFDAIAGTVYRVAVDGYNGDAGSIVLNWNQQNCVNGPATIRLSATGYSVNESSTGATATISRTGSTSAAATVEYFTSDNSGQTKCEPQPKTGLASQRCDYQTTVGTVTIPAGQNSVNISIPIVNDVHVEGSETFGFNLKNAVGATLSTPSTATITINDNDTVFTQANPIDTFAPYVRQQYLDFLSREPDSGGFAFWMGRLQNCAATPGCDMVRERKMVSAGFFYSNEFLLRKGYFIYRFYGASLGTRPTYAEFVVDMASMGQNDAQEEAKRVEFMNRWVTRAAFVARYPSTLSHDQFVDKLLQTAGLNLERTQFAGKTRAQIVRLVVESQQAFDKFFEEGFISMQYFGYLRRDPDAGGFAYWKNRLPDTRQQIDANPDLYIYDMVGGFIYSTEYQLRFGNRNY